MEHTYWHKQTKDRPLFPDFLWNRPQNKRLAGKLLIIGGSSHGFAAPAEAYQEAKMAGVGLTKVLLPLAVKSIAGKLLEHVDYAPTTPSGSFARGALADFIELSEWADGVLIAGDLGRNSETAIVLESYLSKSTATVTLTKDAVDYVTNNSKEVLERPKTLLVVTIAQLQRLFIHAKLPMAITFDMDLLHLVDSLHTVTEQFPAAVIIKHLDQLIVAAGGQVSTTPASYTKEDFWRVKAGAQAAVWWLQNPQKPFEAITTSVIGGTS